ncbi:hypothetical protein ACFYUY_01510 [Kitasatospora sp. NPDC004745]|uniref:hypothetical protein n=1 Tax=Kitasatospora sp. NPDC004745 TaxID=3364019 RepID=UPI0036B263EA
MRPARFQQLLLDAAASLPGAAAKTFADTGNTRHPYGVVVEAGGRTTNWQLIIMSAPGEKWGDHPDAEPVLGEKPAGPAMPAELKDLAAVEQGLVAALLAADPGEIAAVEVYSTLATPPAVGHGATVDLRDGSRAFINHVR